MYIYEMNPTRTVGATERTRDAWQMDGRSKTNIPATTSLCWGYYRPSEMICQLNNWNMLRMLEKLSAQAICYQPRFANRQVFRTVTWLYICKWGLDAIAGELYPWTGCSFCWIQIFGDETRTFQKNCGWGLLNLSSIISLLQEILIQQKYRLDTFNYVYICRVSWQLIYNISISSRISSAEENTPDTRLTQCAYQSRKLCCQCVQILLQNLHQSIFIVPLVAISVIS